jgi:hypothetical protein
MKGIFYIVTIVFLIIQSAVSGFCTNSTIPENNYIKQKSFFKQARCKPVSSYVRKAKKLQVLSVMMPVESDTEKVNGDDLGGDEKWENSREDDLPGNLTTFAFLTNSSIDYSFSQRRYSYFIRFHIPPPK